MSNFWIFYDTLSMVDWSGESMKEKEMTDSWAIVTIYYSNNNDNRHLPITLNISEIIIRHQRMVRFKHFNLFLK